MEYNGIQWNTMEYARELEKEEIILNKILNIFCIIGTMLMVILFLIYLILYPSESEPAADLTPKSEYESQQSELRSELKSKPRSEFIIKDDPGNFSDQQTTKLNEIKAKHEEILHQPETKTESEPETQDDIKYWNDAFSKTLDWIFEYCEGELIQTEALYLNHLEPDFEPGAQLFSNNLKLKSESSGTKSPGSKPKICYYIANSKSNKILSSDLQLLGISLRKIWFDNGYDYNIEILVSYSGNPNQIIAIYDNGEKIY